MTTKYTWDTDELQAQRLTMKGGTLNIIVDEKSPCMAILVDNELVATIQGMKKFGFGIINSEVETTAH